jgi:hypothetical protein
MRRAVRIGLSVAVCVSVGAARAGAQNRGVYPLGMSANNSGVTPASGLTYANQLLFYSRDRAKDDEGNTTATGDNDVLMDMNTFAWVSPWKVLAGLTTPRRHAALREEQPDFGHRRAHQRRGWFADSYYA